MKKRILTVMIGITLALTMVFGLLPACGGGGTGPNASESPGATGAPTAAGETWEWRYQTSGVPGSAVWWVTEEYVKNIKTTTNGRMTWNPLGAGAIVAQMEIFDAVASGAIECGTIADTQYSGKDKRMYLVGLISAHFSWDEAMCYYYADSTGGKELFNSILAKFGIKRINKSIVPPEVGYVANKKIVEASDYKGLTFRAGGFPALVVQEPEFQASGVMLAAADIYTSLQTGVIDACEYSTEQSNFVYNLQEISKYWGYPGIQQLAQFSSDIINLELWNKLPADIQLAIELCANTAMLRNASFIQVESAKLIPVIKEKYGIELVRLSPECQRTWRDVTWRLVDKFGEGDADWKAMVDNMQAHINLLRPYFELHKVDYGGK